MKNSQLWVADVSQIQSSKELSKEQDKRASEQIYFIKTKTQNSAGDLYEVQSKGDNSMTLFIEHHHEQPLHLLKLGEACEHYQA